MGHAAADAEVDAVVFALAIADVDGEVRDGGPEIRELPRTDRAHARVALIERNAPAEIAAARVDVVHVDNGCGIELMRPADRVLIRVRLPDPGRRDVRVQGQ